MPAGRREGGREEQREREREGWRREGGREGEQERGSPWRLVDTTVTAALKARKTDLKRGNCGGGRKSRTNWSMFRTQN